MSTIYKTIDGDTYESIARKQYGNENFAGIIKNANIGLNDPFQPGIFLTIPPNPDAPLEVNQSPFIKIDEKRRIISPLQVDKNEISLIIDNKRFRFWTKLVINRAIDSIDTITFEAPFDPNDDDLKNTFVPFSYKTVEIFVGTKALFKGTIINISPVSENNKRIIVVDCYSLPGVLNECTLPALSSMQFNKQFLIDIVTKLVQQFGLGVKFETEVGERVGKGFEIVAINEFEKVMPFLAKLCKERNIVISSTPFGEVLFQRSISSGVPVANLVEGESPVVGVIANFNPQDYYSSISAVKVIVAGKISLGADTIINKHLKGVMRPFSFQVTDDDVTAALEAKMGRMFANAVSYIVNVATWRDKNGALWKPNTLISLHAPGAMIYNSYTFLIRSISFSKTLNSEIASLNLVPVGAFDGKQPEKLPWQ